MFAPLARRDQRAKGSLYLRGLLLDGRRKSMQPMAERLGVDHQQLQQFMTSSTWPVEQVRARLAWRAVAAVRPQVWVVDDTGFPKDGRSSPGVARQYSGTLGKVGNCQIGVSVHAASDTASCPLSWRLFLPATWDGPNTQARRRACRIPDTEHHRPKWQLALDMLDDLAAAGLRPAVL
ncbi:IS701 family transposase, partial [Streptomyces sp. SAJ15]|uniref:IS701 family transposase n=1 Tax=Streptomyces sp. SAJ15 TaxID=2011095 RepID=UPI0037D9922C